VRYTDRGETVWNVPAKVEVLVLQRQKEGKVVRTDVINPAKDAAQWYAVCYGLL
jgi:hypothetical protein